MRLRILGLLGAALITCFTCLAAAPVQAADTLAIEAFYGNFRGSGISRSDVSDYFGLTVRDLDVTIESAAGGGFTVAWTTVIREGGSPDNPDIRRKSDRLTFAPTARPGVYRADRTGDPLAGEPLTWAHLAGYTLTIHTVSVLDSGDYVVQTYNRTLSDLGMELEFVSVRSGETMRRVEGRLTKYAN